ncbi:MAG TPA: DUF2273 domain-containing protein [Firmicutes bacterium]|uniref:DUF2273 domain-containing protein n=1 Tax=Capillibacterium thermochitinicola TaxID=2699427 RepID=A0A8J6I1X6_9FIRM|nr:DUF2273 domain-containing protein [Capillibacterium thermochitinicola]MBA2132899.1 DUF2273 domain-containing protein [Capillibacterium thermochitinicola]HHW11792.1 DUF2273 domain-containing protein [Bacillota bacterium]
MTEKDNNQLLQLFLTYKGRIFSSALGIVTGILVLCLGWIKALSFAFCVLVGYTLGKRFDRGDELKLPKLRGLFQKRRIY